MALMIFHPFFSKHDILEAASGIYDTPSYFQKHDILKASIGTYDNLSYFQKMIFTGTQ